ncbi:MAG: IS66 family transposase, partial [Acidimicrobiales bacterium]
LEACRECGRDLGGAPIEAIEVRQVFDVPEPKVACTEHRVYKRRCACGALACGSFPSEARAPACYGPSIRAIACYLMHAQHLPVERTKAALQEMLGVEVSTGFLASLAPEAAGGLTGFIEALKARLIGSALVHVDETSDQVGTNTWWLHVVSNEEATYLYADRTRGRAAPDAAGVLGSFSGTMVHDRLAMYFGYEGATHVICGAHLLRDLASVATREAWAARMCTLLIETNAAAHEARDAGRRRLSRRRLDHFDATYDALLAEAFALNKPLLSRSRNALERESYNLAVALRDHKAEATAFARDLGIPFTNNEAERSLRMAKLHHKVSGCFQSERHAKAFATIRSYLATARKHGLGDLLVLDRLFRGDPWMPPAVT